MRATGRKSLAAAQEFFRFFGATFNVTAFRTHAAEHGWPAQRLGLASVAKLCNFPGLAGDGGGLSLFAIDPQRAAELPAEALETPGIVVRFAGSVLLIDGHHRAYRLWCEGKESMPVYLFDDPDILERYTNVPRRVLEAHAA